MNSKKEFKKEFKKIQKENSKKTEFKKNSWKISNLLQKFNLNTISSRKLIQMKKKEKIIDWIKLKPYIKMEEEIKEFDDTEIEENEFHKYKIPILISDRDVTKIVVSNLFPFGKQESKYFIRYKVSQKVRSLWIFRPQIIIYKLNFDENRRICFF